MSSYPGGIENYLINYLCFDSFPSDKVHIDFITYENKIAYEDKLKTKGYRVFRVPHLKKDPLGYFKTIKALFQENRYNSAYVNMLTAANALPVFLASHFHVKTILHAHANSTISGVTRRTLHYINKEYCIRKASVRLACSEKAGKWLFGDSEFLVIPDAIDCGRFKPSEEYRKTLREQFGIADKTLLIGHIGRFAEEKNHIFMLDILQTLREDHVDTVMMFVGDGYTKPMVEQKVIDMNLESNVIFAGTTAEPEKYYPAFDVFLFPSVFEGFGMAALEAQSCGVQCICSDTLSQLLNVTGTIRSLGLQETPSVWAQEIKRKTEIDKQYMHELVRDSEFNIVNQENRLANLLLGEE
jgi:glycosyltransferase involved in cell wall biosynthesis